MPVPAPLRLARSSASAVVLLRLGVVARTCTGITATAWGAAGGLVPGLAAALRPSPLRHVVIRRGPPGPCPVTPFRRGLAT
ncbi:hypothetical protein FHR32_008220 [Streptosporangium album]|uniref:Uncharacterized protein n=1 Tax=Streptosporangium album TaxID=47479 RepID=A0A7W7S4N3_9ACTN|nr:hypothetical protein [Streptosporangium album]